MLQYREFMLKFYKEGNNKRRFRDEHHYFHDDDDMKDNDGVEEWFNGKVENDTEKLNNNII